MQQWSPWGISQHSLTSAVTWLSTVLVIYRRGISNDVYCTVVRCEDSQGMFSLQWHKHWMTSDVKICVFYDETHTVIMIIMLGWCPSYTCSDVDTILYTVQYYAVMIVC